MFFHEYKDYLSKYEYSRINCVRLPAFVPKLKSIIKEFEKSQIESGSSYKLESIMIMPVQRLPRYILLLGDILKHTPQAHPDHPKLKLALEKTKEILANINTLIPQGLAEISGKLLLVIKQIEGGEIIAEPQRKYLNTIKFSKLEKSTIIDKKKAFSMSFENSSILIFEDAIAFVEDNDNPEYRYRYIAHAVFNDVNEIRYMQKFPDMLAVSALIAQENIIFTLFFATHDVPLQLLSQLTVLKG